MNKMDIVYNIVDTLDVNEYELSDLLEDVLTKRDRVGAIIEDIDAQLYDSYQVSLRYKSHKRCAAIPYLRTM